jgi:hypothetical protein
MTDSLHNTKFYRFHLETEEKRLSTSLDMQKNKDGGIITSTATQDAASSGYMVLP